MINRQEIKQRITPAVNTAIQIFSAAYRAPLFFMLGCGYVVIDGKRRPFHDHHGQLTVRLGLVPGTEVDVDTTGGQIVELIEEGEI